MSILSSILQKQRKGATPTPGNCLVLRNSNKGTYYVQPMCRDKATGIFNNWGYLMPVAQADMKSRGLEILSAELRQCSSRASDQSPATSKESPEGRRDAKAWRESVHVSLSLLADGNLEFAPSAKWSRGAWTYPATLSLTLKQPTTAEAFFQTLSAAFDRCTSQRML
jgi:hypothetical protein